MLGLQVVRCPLFAIQPVDWLSPPPSSFHALLLTSSNAVAFAGQSLEDYRSLPVHAVGKATADAAHDAGLKIASVGEHGVESLLAAIPERQRLLHLCGADRIPAATHHAVHECVVYRALPIDDPGLPPLGGATIAVHSPRAGRRLAQLSGGCTTATVVAISTMAADACGKGWGRVAVAERPDDGALLALAASLCQTPPR